MSTDTEERLNKILKYGGAGLLALLILGVFAWRLDLAQRRAATAEKELASLRAETGKVKLEPTKPVASPPADSVAITRKNLAGKWINSSAYGGKDCTRTMYFEENGPGNFSLRLVGSAKPIFESPMRPWRVHADIVLLPDAYSVGGVGGGDYYFRIIRLTGEKLVLINHDKTERVYERFK
jgi:hypothetical protein